MATFDFSTVLEHLGPGLSGEIASVNWRLAVRNQCARALGPPGSSPAGIILGRTFGMAPKLSLLEHVAPGADGWCLPSAL